MIPPRQRRMTRRANVQHAALRRATTDVAATVGTAPRKPFLTHGQVRRFVRRELSNGVPA